MDQPDVAFVDQVEEQDVRVAVALGVRHHEAQIGLDQLLQRALVVLLHTPAELALALRSEARDLRDLVEILVEQIVRIFAFLVPGHGVGNGHSSRSWDVGMLGCWAVAHPNFLTSQHPNG